jgi:hypothetical protein
MKLDRLLSGACAAVVASLLVCGCASSTPEPANTPAKLAALDGRTGTTELMSAQLAGPAPRVGKAHLDVQEPVSEETSIELGAPKEGRGSDGSRRSGNFGSVK